MTFSMPGKSSSRTKWVGTLRSSLLLSICAVVVGCAGSRRAPEPTAVAPAPVHGDAAFIWPVRDGRLLSTFGDPRRRHVHAGIDIGADHGTPVSAAREGRVTYAGSTMRGYGKTVIIEHADEFSSLYAHNSRLLVGPGEWVERGQQIARIGRTGDASTEHCHFEIRRNHVAVDPLPHLSGSGKRR